MKPFFILNPSPQQTNFGSLSLTIAPFCFPFRYFAICDTVKDGGLRNFSSLENAFLHFAELIETILIEQLYVSRRKVSKMATMYVYNIPTNETVNLRATPNGTILVRVPYGAAVEALPSATSGWHNASYNNYSGYIMSQ